MVVDRRVGVVITPVVFKSNEDIPCCVFVGELISRHVAAGHEKRIVLTEGCWIVHGDIDRRSWSGELN